MILGRTKRPRNVDSPRAAAILYANWGTSKAYVIGLAFAVAGYSSFWLILAMSALLALVGINYMAICRHYPDGGGVYASVCHRSKIIAIVGAFLLIADYIVTASISALSGFQYVGVPHPEIFAGVAILGIGELFRSKAYRRIGCCGLCPDSNHCCSPRVLCIIASRGKFSFPESVKALIINTRSSTASAILC